MHILKISVFVLGIASLMTQCKPKESNNSPENPADIELLPSDASAEFPNAGIASMDYQKGQFTYQITGDYKLGEQTSDAPQKMCANSAQGQHIHLIVDDKPYEAKYDSSFHYLISDGIHYILSFLSRSYHESIKTTQASVVLKATIQDSSFKKVEPVNDPMLFYSRPKGSYIGEDAKNIMLDFYLVNCKLGEQYKVKAEVAGKEFTIDKWQAYYLKNLPMGEHTLKLTLVDSSGNPVNTPLNPVSRTFVLQAQPGQ
ncbi:MAG: phosphopeptide-binding protein [Saprospiraceae bacterium]|nr:phosphopeptide-binding protein [Saprospiraceae bacterium]